jgi:8-oxo-dGTP pyrophosphatase MutT (NUDIX family)
MFFQAEFYFFSLNFKQVCEDVEDSEENWKEFYKKLNKKIPNNFSSKLTGIREVFEECGILLVNPEPKDIEEEWREKVHKDASQFKVLCEKYHFAPSVDSLLPFSHWSTPKQEKKRYKTDFYFCNVENSRNFNVKHDGVETTNSKWFSPEDALQHFEKGSISLAPPTWYTLNELKKFKELEKLVEYVKTKEYTTWEPTISKEGIEIIVALPGDKLHEESHQNNENLHRILLKSKQNYEFVKSKL